jgi:Uma2 family endonuclease
MASVPDYNKKLYTPEEYLALEEVSPEKHEYYEGEIFAMAGGSANHNEIRREIFASLHGQLKGKDCKVFDSETRVKIQPTGLYTYCDAAVACKPIHLEATASETLFNPKVLIEVLSPSTEEHDLGFKLKHYRKLASVQEILYFSQDEASVEHFVRDGRRWIITTIEGLGATVTLSSIGCRLELTAVYGGVGFPEAE